MDRLPGFVNCIESGSFEKKAGRNFVPARPWVYAFVVYCRACTFAQSSFSDTVRLNTSRPGAVSGSTLK
jgi:hypothetical protein